MAYFDILVHQSFSWNPLIHITEVDKFLYPLNKKESIFFIKSYDYEWMDRNYNRRKPKKNFFNNNKIFPILNVAKKRDSFSDTNKNSKRRNFFKIKFPRCPKKPSNRLTFTPLVKKKKVISASLFVRRAWADLRTRGTSFSFVSNHFGKLSKICRKVSRYAGRKIRIRCSDKWNVTCSNRLSWETHVSLSS